MRSVELRELMLITIQVRPIVDLGGGRRYVAFDGGGFEGRDGLAGTVLEGGVDWQTVRADGVLEIDAHYTLQTETNEAIEVVSQGVRKASESVTARLLLGDQVGSEPWGILNRVAPVLRFSDNLKVGVVVKQAPHGLTNVGVVIHQQNSVLQHVRFHLELKALMRVKKQFTFCSSRESLIFRSG